MTGILVKSEVARMWAWPIQKYYIDKSEHD